MYQPGLPHAPPSSRSGGERELSPCAVLSEFLLATTAAQVYQPGILHADPAAAVAGTAHGLPLRHVAFCVERNPFSEQLEVSRASYVAEARSD